VLFDSRRGRAEDVPDANALKSLKTAERSHRATVPSRNVGFTLNHARRPVTPTRARSAVKRRFELKRAHRDFVRFDAAFSWHAICAAA
jgi:hypothetical protein